MRLAAMVDLMLVKVEQEPIHSLPLNAIASVYLDDTLKVGGAHALHDHDQTPIHFDLRDREHRSGLARLFVSPSCRSQRATLHCVHVEPIDNQDVIERGAQAWKEAGASGYEIGLRQSRAGGEETMIRSTIVIGHGTVRKDSIHQ